MNAPELADNIVLLGHTDQGGRGDGVQVMVGHGHAYVGHMFSDGVTVLDVRDPRDPRPVGYLPAAPGTWNLHLQLADGLLLVVNAVNLFAAAAFADESAYYGRSVGEVLAANPPPTYRAGMAVYDLADPARPREIGFLDVDGFGLHRIWYAGGRWAYASALLRGFSDYILVTIDLADPAAPRLLVHRNWSPPFGGGTHTALPLPSRDLLIVADEGIADDCADQVKYTWVFDVREPANPVSIATLPTPSEVGYCAKGGHFGPHNLHENRPRVIQSCDVFVDRDAVMYVTDYNAGLYVLQYEPGAS